MSNEAQKTLLEQISLPQLLFRQCHLNCVDSDAFTAETDAEKLCISNCQAKTYQAFDLQWSIRKYGVHMKQRLIDEIDISRYVEFDVEHGHDTSNSLQQKRGVHNQTPILDAFVKQNNRDNAQVREKALNTESFSYARKAQ